jgi:hypothetical protein
MIGSPSTFSLASPATAMFQDTYPVGMAGFTPSPPEYDGLMYEGISSSLRRGPLSFSNTGMPPSNEPVMNEMITSSPGFFTQEEARAMEAIASRGGIGDQNNGTQDVDEEDEHAGLD